MARTVVMEDGRCMTLSERGWQILEANTSLWKGRKVNTYKGLLPITETSQVASLVNAEEQRILSQERILAQQEQHKQMVEKNKTRQREIEVQKFATAQGQLTFQVKEFNTANHRLQTDLLRKAELVYELEQTQASLKNQIEKLESEIQPFRESIEQLEAQLNLAPALQTTIDLLQQQVDRIMAEQVNVKKECQDVLAKLNLLK